MLKTTYRVWPFRVFDLSEAQSYLNQMARKGYALKKIGSLFAVFESSDNMEYIYSLAIPQSGGDNGDVEVTEEEYKQKWIDDGWEFVQIFEGQYIFRTNNRNLRPSEIIQRDQLNKRIIKQVHSKEFMNWFRSVFWIVMSIFNFYISENEALKLMWIAIGLFQLISLFSIIGYIIFKGRIKNDDYVFSYDFENSHSTYIWRSIIKIFLALTTVVYLYIGFIGIILSGGLKEGIIVLVIFAIIGAVIMGTGMVEEYGEKRGKPLFSESKKGKALGMSAFCVITILCVVLFTVISISHDKKQLKDYDTNTPSMMVEDSTGLSRVEAYYYKWEYDKEDGVYMGSNYNDFTRPTEDILNYFKKISVEQDDHIQVNFDKTPKYWNVRYWSREAFLNINSLVDGYKTIKTKDTGFDAVAGDNYYVIYAKWDNKEDGGFGYYIIHGENK